MMIGKQGIESYHTELDLYCDVQRHKEEVHFEQKFPKALSAMDRWLRIRAIKPRWNFCQRWGRKSCRSKLLG